MVLQSPVIPILQALVLLPEALTPKPPKILNLGAFLTGPKPKETTVETFRIDYLLRGPKVEKLSLQPTSL